MQSGNRTKTTKAQIHFFVFFIFFFFPTTSSLSTRARQHPQVLAPKQPHGNRLWHRYLLVHFIIQTAESAQPWAHHPDTYAQHPDKEKAWRISFVRGGHAGAQSLNLSVDSRYEWLHSPLGDIIHHNPPFVLGRTLAVHLLLCQQGYITFTRGSADITLPVIHPLLKYGLQNQFTCRSCLWLSCQAFQLSVKVIWHV